MIVNVVGSWQARSYASSTKWGLRGALDSFGEASQQLGEMLALSNHSLLIASEDVETADWHAVKGFLKVTASRKGLVIYVRRPKNSRRPYQALAAAHPGVFHFETTEMRRTWSATYVQGVHRSDIVITIAGMEGTYLAGQTAVALRKPLIPIGSFGGGALQTLDELANSPALLYSHIRELASQLRSPWSDQTMSAIQQSLNVIAKPISAFISYAREDANQAERVREALERAGISAWKDDHEILPGENFRQKIMRAMQKANCVVICLSSTSVNKTGFVQVEIKEALRLQTYRPEDKIFVIPIRLDKCQVPFVITEQELHYEDLFPDWDAGVARIVQTINTHFRA